MPVRSWSGVDGPDRPTVSYVAGSEVITDVHELITPATDVAIEMRLIVGLIDHEPPSDPARHELDRW